jgi:hypothetical protein
LCKVFERNLHIQRSFCHRLWKSHGFLFLLQPWSRRNWSKEVYYSNTRDVTCAMKSRGQMTLLVTLHGQGGIGAGSDSDTPDTCQKE